MLNGRWHELDLAGYRRIRGLAKNPEATKWIRRGSALGEHGAIWLALGATGALFDGERREQWLRATATVAASYGVSTVIKQMVRRPRPSEIPALTTTPGKLSFPSSHSVTSFTAARAFGGLIPPGPLYTTAIAFGISRLYLGVHYPSDVLAGAALGTMIGSTAR